MTMRQMLILLAAGGSAALLAGAFAFQYLGGLAPCALCLWQRWPHAVAVLLGIAGFALAGRPGTRRLAAAIAGLGALAALATAGIGMFHVGVEMGWWQGLATCSSGSIAGLSADDLLNPDAAVAAPVRCDAVAWSLFGLSMAAWNVVISTVLAGIWLAAARQRA